jgi:hypothetical protein
MMNICFDRFRPPQLVSRPPTLALAVAGFVLVLGLQASAAGPRGLAADEVVPTAFQSAGGGARLIVNVSNDEDATYVARGRTQLNQVNSPAVTPGNVAIAQSSCTDCETMAVALQVSVYKSGASYVAPQNAAVAANGGCLRCFTLAVAVQYVIPVDDPTSVPPDVRRLGRDLDAELRALSLDRSTPVRDRMTGLLDIVDRFRQFAAYVEVRVREASQPSETSADLLDPQFPTATDDPNAAPTVDGSPSPAASDATPGPSQAGATSDPSVAPTVVASPGEIPATDPPSATDGQSASEAPTVSDPPSAAAPDPSSAPEPAPTPAPTASPDATASPSPEPSDTASPAPTAPAVSGDAAGAALASP